MINLIVRVIIICSWLLNFESCERDFITVIIKCTSTVKTVSWMCLNIWILNYIYYQIESIISLYGEKVNPFFSFI